VKKKKEENALQVW